MRLTLALSATLLLGSSLAVAGDNPDDISSRLQTITSRSTHAKAEVPKFAFTSNVSWDAPNSLDEAMFGLPELTLVDKSKTLVGFADPDTAFITTHLSEYSSCPKAGCASAAAESWLRAAAVFERTNGIWQPLAWSITPPIPGDSQVAAMADGVFPDAIPRNVAGADAVALLFQTTLADPKTLAGTVSARKETALFGSELSERYTGAQVKTQLTSWNLGFRVRDGVRAGVSKSGKLAWAAANVDAVQAKRPKAKPIPYRVFAIYELVGTDWKLVALQFSTSV
jgi:hypothetical protein